MTTLDPYPVELLPESDTLTRSSGTAPHLAPEPMPKPGWQPVDPMLAVLTRIAVALEQMVLESITPERPALTPLPAVQVAANRPPCPYHGPDKVASSTKPGGGWYCQAKAVPPQPMNRNGYCIWQVAAA